MGVEISSTEFTEQDFQEFRERLQNESRLLMEWFDQDHLDPTGGICGFELEAWLLDEDYIPAPINEEFLKRVNSHLVVPELSRFNFEINSTPHPVKDGLLIHLENELKDVWRRCAMHAEKMNARILAIGILPTIQDEMLTLKNMSSLRRYYALNKEILRHRGGQPLKLDIQGKDRLITRHQDVMLEAVATSLQIHLQVSPKEAVRHYNAAQILSAPLVAVSANSPYLFACDLWEETRIPTFEQAISVVSIGRQKDSGGRVTFGSGFARHSLIEPFLENLDAYPILLPRVVDEDASCLSHLRLHNGTIWRWNRPLIGINEKGKPHLRIEQRVCAAGPSIVDTIANIAFYLGLAQHLVHGRIPPECQLSHSAAEKNFYQAARYGLNATITWLDGKDHRLQDLLLTTLIPEAREGLIQWGLPSDEIATYFDDIIDPRVRTGKTGACWQRNFIASHGQDFQKMTHVYYEYQKQNRPVHQWDFD